MSHLSHLPIWRDANCLLVAVEQAVRQFPRYHKYTLGTELRRQAMNVCRLILRAADNRGEQLRRIQQLVETVDDLKLHSADIAGSAICLRFPTGSAVRAGSPRA